MWDAIMTGDATCIHADNEEECCLTSRYPFQGLIVLEAAFFDDSRMRRSEPISYGSWRHCLVVRYERDRSLVRGWSMCGLARIGRKTVLEVVPDE
jgi:hypothetical protein